MIVNAFVYHEIGYCFGYMSYTEQKFSHLDLVVIVNFKTEYTLAAILLKIKTIINIEDEK